MEIAFSRNLNIHVPNAVAASARRGQISLRSDVRSWDILQRGPGHEATRTGWFAELLSVRTAHDIRHR